MHKHSIFKKISNLKLFKIIIQEYNNKILKIILIKNRNKFFKIIIIFFKFKIIIKHKKHQNQIKLNKSIVKILKYYKLKKNKICN